MRGDVPHESGFTLVEVLVALIVTALLLGIVMNGALQASARARGASQKSAAVLLARNIITERQVAPLDTAPADGEQGGLTWHVTEAVIARDPRGFSVLTEIHAAVRSTDALLFEATTRKLKRVPRS